MAPAISYFSVLIRKNILSFNVRKLFRRSPRPELSFIFLKLVFLNDSSWQHTKCAESSFDPSLMHARWQELAGVSVCPDLCHFELQLPPSLLSTAHPHHRGAGLRAGARSPGVFFFL